MSECGYLYEANGADTFAYSANVTFHRLVSCYHETGDRRVLHILDRHGRWMSFHILPEKTGDVFLFSASHHSRTPVSNPVLSGLRTRGFSRRRSRGTGVFFAEPGGDRDFWKLCLPTRSDHESADRLWAEKPDIVARETERVSSGNYGPCP